MANPEAPSAPAGPKLATFKPGETIFSEGDKGDKTYIIKQGSVKIITNYDDKAVTLGVLKNGACFGEMAVITDAPRVASAVCETKCHIYVIDKQHIDKMMEDMSPLFRAIINSLIKRVKGLNAFAAEKASFTHPMMAIANLLMLIDKSMPVEPKAAESNAMGLPMGEIVSDNDSPKEDREVQIIVVDLIGYIKNILGYTDHGANKILQKFVKLRLASFDVARRKRVFSFKPHEFVENTNEMVKFLGDQGKEGPTAELEYVDLNELAEQLDLRPQRLLDAIYNGRISQEAILMRRHMVIQSIEDQGRQLF